MADLDFFEITGLVFDNPETNGRRLRVAIARVMADLRAKLNDEEDHKKQALNTQIEFLEARTQEFVDDDKVTQAFKDCASAKTEQVAAAATATLAALRHTQSTITRGGLLKYKDQWRLTLARVTTMFEDAGFTVVKIDATKGLPTFPQRAAATRADLEVLRGLKDLRPGAPDPAAVTDLYAFAVYLEARAAYPKGETSQSDAYRAMSTPQLASLFARYAPIYAPSGATDRIGQICKDLIAAAQTYVFNSEDNRHAYDDFLRYHNPELEELYALWKSVPLTTRRSSEFADGQIAQVAHFFPGDGVALAIYNTEADLKADPYEPDRGVFFVNCPDCLTLNEFEDLASAQKGQCKNCHKPLYEPCRKCRKLVLRGLDRCPECKFVFASAELFVKYFTAAEQALRSSDFDTARSCLAQAQGADPAQAQRTDALRTRIDAEEKRYQQPIKELRTLIASKKFQAASSALATITRTYPDLNTSAFTEQVGRVLAGCQAAFDAAKRLPPQKRADEALLQLQSCIDFQPAIDLLLATAPPPCSALTISLDPQGATATLTWPRSAEQGITYRLVRKVGKQAPASPLDGTQIADGIQDNSFCDAKIQPGVFTSYAVFTVRHGVFSAATTAVASLRAEVRNVHLAQDGQAIRLSWDLPQGCTGVTVSRSQGRESTILEHNAQTSFQDSTVQYGVAYTYRLQANYADGTPSQGATVSATPLVQVDQFTISGKRASDGAYEVSWSIVQPGVDVRIMADGKQVGQSTSSAHHCGVSLPPNGLRQVSVLARSGGTWLPSDNTLTVNTFPPCLIDKAACELTEEPIAGMPGAVASLVLRLKIAGPIPVTVVGFRYTIRTSAGAGHWLKTGEVDRPDMVHVSASVYRQAGEIVWRTTARDEAAYYVSLLTVFVVNGQEVVSEPTLCRISRPLKANLFWKVERGGLFGPPTLDIEMIANRPFDQAPPLVLCAGTQVLLSQEDPRAERIGAFPAVDIAHPTTSYTRTYELGAAAAPKRLKGMRLALFIDAQEPNTTIVTRPATGFTGKI